MNACDCHVTSFDYIKNRDDILTNCRNIPFIYAVENGVKNIKSAVRPMPAA
jgi:hypothetical protein